MRAGEGFGLGGWFVLGGVVAQQPVDVLVGVAGAEQAEVGVLQVAEQPEQEGVVHPGEPGDLVVAEQDAQRLFVVAVEPEDGDVVGPEFEEGGVQVVPGDDVPGFPGGVRIRGGVYFFFVPLALPVAVALRFSSIAACAAARRATGTRNGEQLT